VWPPKVYDTPGIKRVVFIAGGVGINPLMSILSHISELPPPIPFYIKFIYTFRASGSSESICSTLFLERLAKTFANIRSPCVFEVFITKTEEQSGVILCGDAEVAFQGRRINVDDLLESLGPLEERAATIVYVCGVPEMTDKFVETIKAAPGMNERHVLCEKWW
jgi:NAD(P)H-flavin reductase